MTRVIGKELEYVFATLCAKNPGVDQHDIAKLVHDVYEELASQARCTAHLIPLTLNVSRRRLAEGYLPAMGGGAYEPLREADDRPAHLTRLNMPKGQLAGSVGG